MVGGYNGGRREEVVDRGRREETIEPHEDN